METPDRIMALENELRNMNQRVHALEQQDNDLGALTQRVADLAGRPYPDSAQRHHKFYLYDNSGTSTPNLALGSAGAWQTLNFDTLQLDDEDMFTFYSYATGVYTELTRPFSTPLATPIEAWEFLHSSIDTDKRDYVAGNSHWLIMVDVTLWGNIFAKDSTINGAWLTGGLRLLFDGVDASGTTRRDTRWTLTDDQGDAGTHNHPGSSIAVDTGPPSHSHGLTIADDSEVSLVLSASGGTVKSRNSLEIHLSTFAVVGEDQLKAHKVRAEAMLDWSTTDATLGSGKVTYLAMTGIRFPTR